MLILKHNQGLNLTRMPPADSANPHTSTWVLVILINTILYLLPRFTCLVYIATFIFISILFMLVICNFYNLFNIYSVLIVGLDTLTLVNILRCTTELK